MCKFLGASLLLLLVPIMVLAGPGPGESLAYSFVADLNQVILFPLIALLTAAALVYFLWGAFVFIANADNDQARSTGRQHMLYGVIGLLVMFSAFTLLQIAANTFGSGVGATLECASDLTDAEGNCVEVPDTIDTTPGNE